METIASMIGPVLVAGVAAYILYLGARFVIAVENIAIIMAKATDPDLANKLIGGAKPR